MKKIESCMQKREKNTNTETIEKSPCLPIRSMTNIIIQGGPERMQQFWSLISRTSSIKRIIFLFYWVENSFSNKMTPWPLILGKAFGYYGYFSEAMSFSKFATFSILAILGTARMFRFTASRRINCCVMNSSVCSHCLRFQIKCSVSATGGREVRILLCSKVRWGRKSTKFWKWHCLTKIALGFRRLTQH